MFALNRIRSSMYALQNRKTLGVKKDKISRKLNIKELRTTKE